MRESRLIASTLDSSPQHLQGKVHGEIKDLSILIETGKDASGDDFEVKPKALTGERPVE